MARLTAVIIGAGNVATHLAKSIDQRHRVAQVYSRHIENARALASALSCCQATDSAEAIITDADIYIISVSDDAIADMANTLRRVRGIVAHTSGSVGIEALGEAGSGQGVIYPLQTFSKNAEVDMERVPFFIEGSDPTTEEALIEIASEISRNVYKADSDNRQVLHIAAVFGCNFFNHQLDVAQRILAGSGYSLDVLRPLLEVTLDKAIRLTPYEAQTGPALRGDRHIIEKHLSRLSGRDKDIYETMTQAIIERHNITDKTK